MDAAKRIKLIRAKVRRPTLAPYVAAGLTRASAQLPPRKPMPYQPANGGHWIIFDHGGYTDIQEYKTAWFGEPDKEPDKPRVAPKKRRKGKHYLSRIVEKMPGKLPQLTRQYPV